MGVLWRALGMETPGSLGKPVGGGLTVGRGGIFGGGSLSGLASEVCRRAGSVRS